MYTQNDYLKLLDEFDNRQIVLKSMPARFHVEFVKGCPGSCAMCGLHYTKPQTISKDLLRKIEPYFKNLQVLGIHGTGEPLLGDIPYFVGQSVKHGFILHMNTTGFFLSKRLSDMLLGAELSIKFSINAARPDTYKKIMGYDFQKALENVTYLIKKAKAGKKVSNFGFSFIVMKENIDEIEDFLKLAHNIGVEQVRFMRLRPNEQILQGAKMPDREFEFNYAEQNNSGIKQIFLKRLPYYKELAEKLGIRIAAGSFGFAKREEICKAPWFGQLQIKQDGSVRPCCILKYSLGNLNNSTLEEIWNSEGMQRIRNSFKNGRFLPECSSCQSIGGIWAIPSRRIL